MDLELEPLESEIKNSQPADFKTQQSQQGYTGKEHRLHARRLTADRRQIMRYEPGKEDRRSNTDRRAGNSWNNAYSL